MYEWLDHCECWQVFKTNWHTALHYYTRYANSFTQKRDYFHYWFFKYTTFAIYVRFWPSQVKVAGAGGLTGSSSQAVSLEER